MSPALNAIGRIEHRAVSGLPRWLILASRMASDGAVVYLAFRLAYWLRYSVELGGTVSSEAQQPLSFFNTVIVLLMALVVVMIQVRGIYRLPRWTTFLDEASSIANAVTTATSIVILYAFLQRFYPSRLIFIFVWVLVIALLVLKRAMTRLIRERFWLRGIGVDRLLVVGAGHAGQRLLQFVLGQPQLGYQVVGVVDDAPLPDNWAIATERRIVHPTHLGTCAELGEIVERHGIDEVIIALPPNAHEQLSMIVDQCRTQQVEFKLVPDLFELTLDRVHIHEVAGLPLIGVRPASISGMDFFLKRSIDIVVATLVLTVLSPLVAIIAVAIKLDSPGPVMFRQERVGRNGRRFICFKFRSMVENADELKAELTGLETVDDRLVKFRDDPRRTRVGKLLRRTSLDELPQFFNVLVGDMSVVGPRPQVPEEVARYDDWHRDRLLVTPGLTGLWQVSGRSNLTFDEMVRLDLYYAEHWSPGLDLKIILRTIPAILMSRGAY